MELPEIIIIGDNTFNKDNLSKLIKKKDPFAYRT
jgi:hypothetical protein